MNTHEAARLLEQIARALRAGADRPLADIGREPDAKARISKDAIPVALTTLVSLSRLDKAQWLEFAREYQIPLDIRPRDASRDILGKILRHLEENADARVRVSKAAEGTRSDTSPELMKALKLLLGT